MQITSNYPRWIRCTLALTAGFLLLPFLPALHLEAQQRHKGHPAQKHKAHPAQKHKVHHVKSADKPLKRHSTHRSTRHHYTHHRSHHYHRHYARARARLQPERVKEIQQALASAGYLQEAPTGRWDTATREAMRHYQQANGFNPTGLPEAKPLMALGLGPHPLPPDLQPAVSASADVQGNTEASSAADASTPPRLSSQAQ